jgi:hypothetical protein
VLEEIRTYIAQGSCCVIYKKVDNFRLFHGTPFLGIHYTTFF